MFRHLHREPGFYKRLFLLALPLILQNLITTSLGFVDTFMVGMPVSYTHLTLPTTERV